MFAEIFSSAWYNYLILPLFIFVARIIDVGLGTLRVILMTKGMKNVAPVLSFFEIIIWLLAIRQIFTNLTNPVMFFAYAAGFATGTYVGMWLEERLSFGKVLLRIITGRDSRLLLAKLREEGHKFTTVDAKGADGNVSIIYLILSRKEIKKVTELMHEFKIDTFYSIEDLRFAPDNFPKPKRRFFLDFLRGIRKAK